MEQTSITEPSGVLIIHKPAGITSHDVVNRIRRLYATRRVGHTGTLDPMATGVLVVLIGRAAKASEYLTADRKRYRARLRLGITTDTEDTTGEVLSTTETIPSTDEFLAALPAFCGRIQQIPPMYSALKVQGKKLVDLARQGIVVDRQARQIEILTLDATPTDDPAEYLLDVYCSGGTYIRTLCADIGASLGCGAAMAALERTETGGFSIAEAHTLEALELLPPEQRLACLIPTERLFASLSELRLPHFYETLCRNGCEIYQKKIGTAYAVGDRLRLSDAKGSFFGIGEVRDYPDGSAVKAIKLFALE